MRLKMALNQDVQSDEQLLERIAKQDKLALEKLYQYIESSMIRR